jgi:hypothetical protein
MVTKLLVQEARFFRIRKVDEEIITCVNIIENILQRRNFENYFDRIGIVQDADRLDAIGDWNCERSIMGV